MESPLFLPSFSDHDVFVVVKAIHAPAGQQLARGAVLMDIEVTLGQGESHDCPPVSHYRLHTRESATLLHWNVNVGDQVAQHTLMAGLLIPSSDKLVAGSAAKPLRLTMVGIVVDHHI